MPCRRHTTRFAPECMDCRIQSRARAELEAEALAAHLRYRAQMAGPRIVQLTLPVARRAEVNRVVDAAPGAADGAPVRPDVVQEDVVGVRVDVQPNDVKR